MKFYVVIPARYDSSRFPGKVLTEIGSKTMLEHVFDNAMKSSASKVFIATDSNRVFHEAQKFTENVFMTSDNNINGTERIAELSKILDWPDETLVINLQADMPQLQCDNIDFLADKAKNNSGLSTTPSSSLSKNAILTFLLSWKPSASVTTSSTCHVMGYPTLLPDDTILFVFNILTVSLTLLPVV